MNVQKEERVEDSLELLMEDEEGEVVEDSFDKIQEQKQDDNEEEVSSWVPMDFDLMKIVNNKCLFMSKKKKTNVCYDLKKNVCYEKNITY